MAKVYIDTFYTKHLSKNRKNDIIIVKENTKIYSPRERKYLDRKYRLEKARSVLESKGYYDIVYKETKESEILIGDDLFNATMIVTDECLKI